MRRALVLSVLLMFIGQSATAQGAVHFTIDAQQDVNYFAALFSDRSMVIVCEPKAI
jgi:hypothetical protein